MASDFEHEGEFCNDEITISPRLEESDSANSDGMPRQLEYLPAFDGDTHWYDDLKELYDAINRSARMHGYAVVKRTTRLDKAEPPRPRRVEFKCDHHGVYKPATRTYGKRRRKKTSTQKTNCPMRIDGYRDRATGRWFIKCYDVVEQGGVLVCPHNHGPSDQASSHSVLRRMDRTVEIEKQIIADAEIGIRPTQTLARLKKNDPEIALLVSDITNIRDRVERERVGDMTRTEFLLSVLEGGGTVCRSRNDSEDRLSHLFFAKQEVLDVFAEGPDVILMDCTYKTNKFGMPLLNMIETSGMNTTTHLAHAFPRGETTEDYVWALSSLKDTLTSSSISFPNVIFVDRDLALLSALEIIFQDVPVLLCLWHVIKAVETHARQTFRRVVDEVASKAKGRHVLVDSPQHREFCDKFLELVRATTEEAYELHRGELRSLSPKEAAYLDSTWLDKWKKKIVRCWTNEVRHFGLQTTSRVEGYHRILKRWLDASTGDLLSLFYRLQAWWTTYLTGHRVAKSNTLAKSRTDLSAMFRYVQKKIHNHALDQCVKQLDLITNSICSGVYTRTTGLPCVHKLRELRREKKPLVPSDFDVHWWIKRSDWHAQGTVGDTTLTAQVQDPAVSSQHRAEQHAARRHSAPHIRGTGVNGTRRAPSAFELSEGSRIPPLESVLGSSRKRLCVLPPIRLNL